uniref:RUS1 family protein C16orf58 homolog isoform X3 n=1 Tax=Callorhinus ursinus TaxID=34884 RepID=A0A3Q7NEY0_CALUR|nr:RUS1 family protein C16orf58 homolog isoform X3 [Callorhinus ursinus]
MAEGRIPEAQLCSEQFGSGAARGCLAAADGSLQWEVSGWRWWGFSGPFTAKPQRRDGGAGGTPGTASPPLSGLMAVFLPQGFPDSVSPDYLPYQLWDSVQCIVSVAGGATRAALTMHQARRNNMADVSAKDSSQETLVNLAGLLVSLLMLPLVSACPSFSLGCFFFLTALHIYANYRAVRALVLETLNEGRLRLVLKHFLQRGEVLGPTSANQTEPLWTGFWPSLSLCLGVPLHRLISSVFELQQLAEGHQEPYLLRWDQSQNQVQVVLSQMAGPETILRAATHGLVLEALQGDGPLPRELEELRNRVRAGPEKESWVIVRETHRVLDRLFPKFLKGNILKLHGSLASGAFSSETLPNPFPCLQYGEGRGTEAVSVLTICIIPVGIEELGAGGWAAHK